MGECAGQRWEDDNWVDSYREKAVFTKKNLKNRIAGIFDLSQNYPNPFNTVSTIEYRILNKAFVNLSVYNSLGQLVSTLVNEEQQAGRHILQWDATALSSGVYFYKLATDNKFSQTKKMILLK